MTITPDATLFLLLVGIAVAFALICFGAGYLAGRNAGRPARLPKAEVKRRLERIKTKKPRVPEQYEDAWHKAQTEPLPKRIPTMEVE